ncbi:transglutaminase family protein [Thiocystis violacea]|uniref:transglutaminase family protein n=1 Tax=Thiocystis violacea TaxID=13725 RepID=UPI001903BCFC|nr:transglutaminase family protein [Thiocystis violacea]MBK1723597.1 cysteine protease [Thiocystis violacea]
MQRYRILHRTYYNFPAEVVLEPHAVRLRPRESHELRIESSSLTITPSATLRWHRDVEDNSVAIATFATPTSQLLIESEVVIQQSNPAPLDFLVDENAVNYPFVYPAADKAVLAPYMDSPRDAGVLADWVATIWKPGEPLQTYTLLERLSSQIQQRFRYEAREAPGVQTPAQTLSLGTGSCRDFACLFMEAARHLGFAARFVSGYLQVPPSSTDLGSTHAWAEVYLPGAGWKGLDPTLGELAGPKHIAVAVARLPDSVPPVAGAYLGPPGATLDVGVWVSPV